MDDERLLSEEDLPVDVSELSELYSAELECPGVYHLTVNPETDHNLFPSEYYLVLPVPALTPWGYTTRHRALASGIYWIETDQCEEVLALGYPVWGADISESILRHARQTDYNTEHGINRTSGYKFFSKKQSCVVTFELLQYQGDLRHKSSRLPRMLKIFYDRIIIPD